MLEFGQPTSRPENLRTDNRAGSLEAAKEEFEECWRKWKAWAKLEKVFSAELGGFPIPAEADNLSQPSWGTYL